jgi:acyl dehydratase
VMSEKHQKHENDAGVYLDDLQVGQRFTSGTYVIEEAQIKAFAAEFDPQPFHLDEVLLRPAFSRDWRPAAGTRLQSL